NHILEDTVRGLPYYLATNNINGQTSLSTAITSFNTNGFSIDSANFINESGENVVSWTFQEQPKFFDIVSLNSSTSTYN
ncbi:DUF7483 domain-containing protein, partial [Staphylococcus aureus]